MENVLQDDLSRTKAPRPENQSHGGAIVIDAPDGQVTVYAHDPRSPAAPYVREYRPRTIEDLYAIGLIHRSIDIQHVQAAYQVVQRGTLHTMFIPSSAELASLSKTHSSSEAERYVLARSRSLTRETAIQEMTRHLTIQFGYGEVEAALTARKVHALPSAGEEVISPFFAVELAANLIIKTPLLLDKSINMLVAHNVLIAETGELLLGGRYLLLRCASIKGYTSWKNVLHEQFPVHAS